MLKGIFPTESLAAVCLAGVAAGLLTPSPSWSQETAPAFTATTLAEGTAPPQVDGRVADEVWQQAAPLTSFTQQDPVEGAPATERTDVRLLFTRTHVYIGIICFDSDVSRIIVSQARRDAPLNDTDSVVLILDTFNDSQNAFVFGTNPLGIEYDGQVAREGQTGGSSFSGGAGGTQRGSIGAFNPNWDGDWTVRAQMTERGWEAEMAIPLKTLRYAAGDDRTWGFNVMRNIRHKNEQVYLSPIPRGFDIYRVSMAAKVNGLTLPPRRDVKLIPYSLGSVNKDFTRTSDLVDRNADLGADLKWGIRPNLTLDATVNTDFAQVEADEEQVNLTRFDLFFPEKRPFFVENASTFQFGQAQAIDLFFSRRIGISAGGAPIDILGGTRLSGKVAGSWNVGLLNIQTADGADPAGRLLAPDTNFSVIRLQKEVGRSSYGGIFVGRYATGDTQGAFNKWNRAYGVDANVQLAGNQRVSAFVARTDSPGTLGSDYAGRAYYNLTNNLWDVGGGYSQVGERFNPEVGFLPRRGYRRPEIRVFFTPQPRSIPWIRRVAPHMNWNAYYGFDGRLQSSSAHIHPFEIQPARGGRFGAFVTRAQDNPLQPFTVYNRDGRRVVIPAGQYTWYQPTFEYLHDPSAAVTWTLRYAIGQYYDGEFNSLDVSSSYRLSERLTASLGWTRQDAELPGGSFVANLVPVKASYSFTTLASLSALVQYNGQTAQFSSNVRLALLDRSGTGLFLVYNDRRDTTSATSYDTLGRSFVVKYTRLLDL